MRVPIFALCLLGATVAAAPAHAQIAFEQALRQNVFVLGSAWQDGADAEGGIAVGNDLWIGPSGFSTGSRGGDVVVGGSLLQRGSGAHFGDVLVGQNATIDANFLIGGALKAGGDVAINADGSVGGGVTYGGTYSGTSYIPHAPGTVTLPIDFAAARTGLLDDSQALASLGGTVIASGGNVVLNASGNGLSVFEFTKSAFESLTQLSFVTSDAPTVLINVLGAQIDVPNIDALTNGVSHYVGDGGSRILFNFAEADTLHVSAFSGGSILAPRAILAFDPGLIQGSVIVGQLGTAADPSRGQFNVQPFTGSVPGRNIPEPTSGALLALTGGIGLMALRRRR